MIDGKVNVSVGWYIVVFVHGKDGVHERCDVCHSDESNADGFVAVSDAVAVMVGLCMVEQLCS